MNYRGQHKLEMGLFMHDIFVENQMNSIENVVQLLLK